MSLSQAAAIQLPDPLDKSKLFLIKPASEYEGVRLLAFEYPGEIYAAAGGYFVQLLKGRPVGVWAANELAVLTTSDELYGEK